jgi:hypothetical protein
MPDAKVTMNRAMTEAQLFESVRAHLDAFKWRFYHTHNSRRSNAGFPDIVAVRQTTGHDKPSRLAFIELKREKGKLTDAQQAWNEDLFLTSIEGSYGCGESTRCEGVRFDVYLWRPSDLSSGRIEEALR